LAAAHRVAFASIAGEVWDVIDTVSHGGNAKWGANWKDIWNTMSGPSFVQPRRFTRVLKR
jgi:hypothetical protein